MTLVCSPQIQERGPVLSGAVPDVPVSREVLTDINRSDGQRLQELQESQRWAECQEPVLRVQAPVFVPALQGQLILWYSPWTDGLCCPFGGQLGSAML